MFSHVIVNAPRSHVLPRFALTFFRIFSRGVWNPIVVVFCSDCLCVDMLDLYPPFPIIPFDHYIGEQYVLQSYFSMSMSPNIPYIISLSFELCRDTSRNFVRDDLGVRAPDVQLIESSDWFEGHFKC